MSNLLPFILFALLPQYSEGQIITALETKWQNSFKEWIIYTEGDSLEGSLELLWDLDDDWSEWQFDLGDLMGTAKLRNRQQNLWEFKAGGELISARPVWTNDLSEWRISNGKQVIKLKVKYRELPIVWYSVGEEYGYIDIFMEFENEPGLWLVEDYLDEDISSLYRFAFIFLSVYHSIPQY